MENPFLKEIEDGSHRLYIDSDCSINKVVLKFLPIKGIDDEIEGKLAGKIFSTKVIVDYIKKRALDFGVDLEGKEGNELPKFISRCFLSEDDNKRQLAEDVVCKFGHRLGLILLVLRTADPINREARKEWDDRHWDYWQRIEQILLVGGLSNDQFGEKLKFYAEEIFRMANVPPYKILLFHNASHLGIMGCARAIQATDTTNVVFDFGQTNIKRSVVKKVNNVVVDERSLPSMESRYMDPDIEDTDILIEQAKCLHEYLTKAIQETYMELLNTTELGNEIIISIASYTVGGKLNDKRGGYAKLSLLADNYASYLEKDLSVILNKEIKVMLIHDGTAIALHFMEYEYAVCLSIGTAFGVGFPSKE